MFLVEVTEGEVWALQVTLRKANNLVLTSGEVSECEHLQNILIFHSDTTSNVATKRRLLTAFVVDSN